MLLLQCAFLVSIDKSRCSLGNNHCFRVVGSVWVLCLRMRRTLRPPDKISMHHRSGICEDIFGI
ncbi:hypothetical protein BRADI_1g74543v3 [Brachypodium distachyon]|uniref:Uncharacterized protein n=1 Tax=Brachypodium distachyon TaxID=15368 RepID=A0A0Q3HKQ9_BRADI|nr:hypothetical protein BRADI_1g74543v3 [Brachypodium distachyon]